MTDRAKPPDDPIVFIRNCVRDRKILWTYHVSMRLSARAINRDAILFCVDTYEVIESYPDDKYLPSYLVLGRPTGDAVHVLFAADVEGDNVRIVTAYRPNSTDWDADLKKRLTP
jgi:Domain of unknown function (DUF4258)